MYEHLLLVSSFLLQALYLSSAESSDADFYSIDAPLGDELAAHHRTRRQAMPGIGVTDPLIDAEKQAILDKHREFRSNTQPTAANMQWMVSLTIYESENPLSKILT